MAFVAWTVFQCFWHLGRLALPRASILPVVLQYIGGVLWLERHILNLDYRVVGSLPRHGPVLVAMKHQSVWETLKLHILFENPSIIVKQELLDLPLWGRYARRMGLIGIDRRAGSRAMDALAEGAKSILSSGRCLVIFPEGTRVPAGQHRPYRGGIARMYELTRLPIVPVALNSGLFWPKSWLCRRGGIVTVQVLDAIPAGLDPRQALQMLETRLNEASDRLLEKEDT